MIQRMFSFTLFVGLLSACSSRTSSDKDAVKIAYVHRYGVEVANEQEWRDQGASGKIEKLLNNGQTSVESFRDGKLHGASSLSYPFTNINQMEAFYHNGVCEWKVTNYASGVPERKEQYGANNGMIGFSMIVSSWYEDSLPRMKEEYQDARLLNGEYISPQQVEESRVSDGTGERIIRDGHGALVSKQVIQDGQVVEETKVYPNGMPQAVLPYVNGKIDGTVKTYQVTGEPSTIEEWQEDTRNGEMRLFSNGEQVATVSYMDGLKEGIEKRYRPGTNEVVEKISWKNGRRHGPTLRFIDDQKIIEWYFDDEKVSKMQFVELDSKY